MWGHVTHVGDIQPDAHDPAHIEPSAALGSHKAHAARPNTADNARPCPARRHTRQPRRPHRYDRTPHTRRQRRSRRPRTVRPARPPSCCRQGERSSVLPPLGPNRSVFTRCGSWPAATSRSAIVSTNPVGPQTNTAGASAAPKPNVRKERRVDSAGRPRESGRRRRGCTRSAPQAADQRRSRLELLRRTAPTPAIANRVEEPKRSSRHQAAAACAPSPSTAPHPNHRRSAAPANQPRDPRRTNHRSVRAARSDRRPTAPRPNTATPRRPAIVRWSARRVRRRRRTRSSRSAASSTRQAAVSRTSTCWPARCPGQSGISEDQRAGGRCLVAERDQRADPPGQSSEYRCSSHGSP